MWEPEDGKGFFACFLIKKGLCCITTIVSPLVYCWQFCAFVFRLWWKHTNVSWDILPCWIINTVHSVLWRWIAGRGWPERSFAARNLGGNSCHWGTAFRRYFFWGWSVVTNHNVHQTIQVWLDILWNAWCFLLPSKPVTTYHVLAESPWNEVILFGFLTGRRRRRWTSSLLFDKHCDAGSDQWEPRFRDFQFVRCNHPSGSFSYSINFSLFSRWRKMCTFLICHWNLEVIIYLNWAQSRCRQIPNFGRNAQHCGEWWCFVMLIY